MWIDVPVRHLRDGTLPLVSVATGGPADHLAVIRSRRGPLLVPLGRADRQFKVLGALTRVVIGVIALGTLALAAAIVGFSVGAGDAVTSTTWTWLGVLVGAPLLGCALLLVLDPPAYRVRVVDGGSRAKLLVHQGFVDAVLPPRPTTWLARWKPGPYNYRGRGAAVLTVASPDAGPLADDVIDLRN